MCPQLLGLIRDMAWGEVMWKNIRGHHPQIPHSWKLWKEKFKLDAISVLSVTQGKMSLETVGLEQLLQYEAKAHIP